MDPSETLLRQALNIVTGARRKNYGTPEDNFACIADLWNGFLHRRFKIEIELEPSDIAALMVLMKAARLAETPAHADSWRDIAGYAACGARASGADLSDGPNVEPCKHLRTVMNGLFLRCMDCDAAIEFSPTAFAGQENHLVVQPPISARTVEQAAFIEWNLQRWSTCGHIDAPFSHKDGAFTCAVCEGAEEARQYEEQVRT